MTQHVSDADFGEEVLNSKEPVLVDFWAEWCGPCLAIAPVLDELSTELSGKVKIVKLNVDQNPSTTAKYGVRSIPTMILFKGGGSCRHEDRCGHAQGRPKQVADQSRRLRFP